MNNWQIIALAGGFAIAAAVTVRAQGRREGDRNFIAADNARQTAESATVQVAEKIKVVEMNASAQQQIINKRANLQAKTNPLIAILSGAAAPFMLSQIPGAAPVVTAICSAIINGTPT